MFGACRPRSSSLNEPPYGGLALVLILHQNRHGVVSIGGFDAAAAFCSLLPGATPAMRSGQAQLASMDWSGKQQRWEHSAAAPAEAAAYVSQRNAGVAARVFDIPGNRWLPSLPKAGQLDRAWPPLKGGSWGRGYLMDNLSVFEI